jgi:hypothetical protein
LVLLLLLIVQSPPEEHDVWLGAMNGIVNPPTTLLHPNSTPFVLRKKTILGKEFGHFRRKNNVPVLIGIVEVFLGILDLTHLKIRVSTEIFTSLRFFSRERK